MTDFTATLRADVLDHLWPHAPAALKAGMVSTSAAAFAKYGIGTLADMTDFMAEISEETAGGIALSENLDYSAARSSASSQTTPASLRSPFRITSTCWEAVERTTLSPTLTGAPVRSTEAVTGSVNY